MSQGLAAAGAGDWLTAPFTTQVSSSVHCASLCSGLSVHLYSPLNSLLLQRPQHELRTSEEGGRSKVTDERLPPGSQSKRGSDTAVAERWAQVVVERGWDISKYKFVLNTLLSYSVIHQRTQTLLWLQLWPKTSVCTGETWSHTEPLMWLAETLSRFLVFLNMIEKCWRSTSPQVPQVSESEQQRPPGGCTEHVHHRKCFSRRGRAFKSWCSGKVFSTFWKTFY